MRPLDQELRERYTAGVRALKESQGAIDKHLLAETIGAHYDAVRTFLNRNPEILAELGVKHQAYHSMSEYSDAKNAIAARGQKITHAILAKELQLDRTSVTRFLDAHPEFRDSMGMCKRKSPMPRLRTDMFSQWRWGITVQHFDDRVQRIVLGKVTPAQYAQLWKYGRLKFQIDKAIRSEHLPSLEEAEAI